MSRILIVEDNSDIRRSLVDCVSWEQNGIQVIAAVADGQQALEYLSDETDVVITDIVMSKMDGITLAGIIQKKHPFTKVIFISAHSEFQYAKNAIRFGVFDYVNKPVQYEYMLETVLRALEEKENERLLRERVRQSLPLFREKLLMNLVLDENLPPSFETDCAYLGLDFDREYYQCIVFEIGHLSDQDMASEEMRIQHYKLMEKIVGAFPDCENMIFSVQSEITVLLYGRSGGNEAGDSALYDKLETLITDVESKFSAALTIGIGFPVEGHTRLSYSYKSALDALESKFFLGYGRLYSYGDAVLAAGDLPDIRGIMSYKSRLACAVKYGNPESVSSIIEEIDREIGKTVYDKEQIKLFAIASGAELILLVEEVGGGKEVLGRVSGELSSMVQKIQSLHTKDEFIHAFCGSMMTFALIFQELRSSKSSNTIYAITDYIDRHYTDMVLNINRIAGEMYMSPGYIGAIFKKQTGKSISEYIMETRVNAAKILLEKSQWKVYEVSAKVGFESPFYFSTCFKKVTGYSPNDYKNQIV